MSIRKALLLCATLMVTACGKESPVNPDGDSEGVTGTINGAAFTNSTWSLFLPAVGAYVFQSDGPLGGVGLDLRGVTGPGTYQLGWNGSATNIGYVRIGTQNWTTAAGPNQGNGSATLTTVTPSRLVGSASFTAYPYPGEGGTPKTATFSFNISVNTVGLRAGVTQRRLAPTSVTESAARREGDR